MLKQFKIAFITMGILLLTACGFQFQNTGLIPKELQQIRLEGVDPYSDIAIAIRHQLQLNNIEIVQKADLPVLRLNKISQTEAVASIFKYGREAEKVLMLQVDASLTLPNKTATPISLKVNRTFFDNARAALAKSAEKEVIWKDMSTQAARQLIVKMVALQQTQQ